MPRPYHDDSDADDEFERGSFRASPGQPHTDSDEEVEDDDDESQIHSSQHTPTIFEHPEENGSLPRTVITEWTPEECAQFVATLSLRQYCEACIEHGIVGEALIALKHDELKEMGIASVGHRLTILKQVYETKVRQGVPIEPDDYIPLSAEQSAQTEMATKDDIIKLTKSLLRLKDERIAQAEAQLTRLADDYRKLRQELLPVFKMAKERSEPLPTIGADNFNADTTTNNNTVVNHTVVPEKTSLSRTFSKKFGLASSTPKNHSPTHLANLIHEGRTAPDGSFIDPSAAANAASNQLTAQMSGGVLPQHAQHSQHTQQTSAIPSPTSPLPYQNPPLTSRAFQREPSSNFPRYDGTEDMYSRAGQPTPPLTRDYEPPLTAKPVFSAKAHPTNSTISNMSTATTLIPSREHSMSVPPQSTSNSLGNGYNTNGPLTAGLGYTPSSNNIISQQANAPVASSATTSSTAGAETPSTEIFKSFRVGLDDPCHKVLPAALRKYNIHADWRQYALYIVYNDHERCVGLDEKPLALFKDLDREGKKPMFMLRRLASAAGDTPGSGGLPPSGGMGLGGSGLASNSMPGMNSGGGRTPGLSGSGVGSGGGIRSMAMGSTLPGGVL